MKKDNKEKTFERLSLEQRIQHGFMILSFTLLSVTGIPMRFPEVSWLKYIYFFFGGLQGARIVHRISAVIMILLGLYHLYYIFRLLVINRFNVWKAWPMVPTLKDAKDWWATSLYYFGLRDKLPLYDRFNFREKFDYFAVFWGVPVMMFSGLILWFPVFFGNFLPNIAIPMAFIAHSDEAVLAISAIVVWHFYNVHYNPDKFPGSTVWLDGKLTEEEIIKEHPLEYERITGNKIKE